MSTPTPTAVLQLPCTKCGSRFPATIGTPMLAALDRAGVRPEEVLERVERGLLSWQVTCPSCAAHN